MLLTFPLAGRLAGGTFACAVYLFVQPRELAGRTFYKLFFLFVQTDCSRFSKSFVLRFFEKKKCVRFIVTIFRYAKSLKAPPLRHPCFFCFFFFSVLNHTHSSVRCNNDRAIIVAFITTRRKPLQMTARSIVSEGINHRARCTTLRAL